MARYTYSTALNADIPVIIQLENSILELLVDNLMRLNEAEESDRQGVFHILGTLVHSYVVRLILRTEFTARCLREHPRLQPPIINTTCLQDILHDLVT